MDQTAWITTFEGRRVDILHPTVDMIHMDDVSRSLAKKCRYNGFLDIDDDDIYSVAQHSVYVSRLMGDNPDDRLYGWAHDVPEYVLMDVVTPFKQVLPDYKAIEAIWEPVCYAWAGVEETPERHALMKEADWTVLMMEMHQFGRWLEESSKYPKLFDYFGGGILKPSEARQMFVDEHADILIARAATNEPLKAAAGT